MVQATEVQTFTIQPIQLAEAMHGFYPCSFDHNEKHKKYVKPSECPRLQRLRDDSVSIMRRAVLIEPRAFSGRSTGGGTW